MAAGAGLLTARYGLCQCLVVQQVIHVASLICRYLYVGLVSHQGQGLASDGCCRDKDAVHLTLDSTIRRRRMCRRRSGGDQGAQKGSSLPLLRAIDLAVYLSVRSGRPSSQGVRLSQQLSPGKRPEAVAGHVGLPFAERTLLHGTGETSSSPISAFHECGNIGRSVHVP